MTAASERDHNYASGLFSNLSAAMLGIRMVMLSDCSVQRKYVGYTGHRDQEKPVVCFSVIQVIQGSRSSVTDICFHEQV